MLEISDLKHIVRRRLEFLEFQLLWEGKIGRKALQNQFSISPQQATLDINQYLEVCPTNLFYDPKEKSYIKSKDFSPYLLKGEASEYLSQLEMLHMGHRNEHEVWVSSLPEFDSVSVPKRQILTECLLKVLNALRNKSLIEVHYIAVNNESEPTKFLVPTAIANDGHRWHMRAFNTQKNRFSDYVLSRIDKISITSKNSVELPIDNNWDTFVTPIFRASRSLNEIARKSTELEYGMKSGTFSIKIRKAMLWYYLRHYGFNPYRRENQHGPMVNESSFNLELVNIEQVEQWLERRS